MKLYYGPLSMFSAKVLIAIAEKNIACETELVPFGISSGYDPKHPEVERINPKGQVPVLTDGSLEIYDSTQILEYLEDAYPNPPFGPRAPSIGRGRDCSNMNRTRFFFLTSLR